MIGDPELAGESLSTNYSVFGEPVLYDVNRRAGIIADSEQVKILLRNPAPAQWGTSQPAQESFPILSVKEYHWERFYLMSLHQC